MPHIKVRFTEELGCFELVCFFKVHALHGLGLGRREITSRLTTDPASSHIRNLRGRHQTIHLFIQRSRDAFVVDTNALGGLLHLAEDVILKPLQRFLVTGRTRKDVTAGRDNFLHTILAIVRFQLWQFLKGHRHTHLVTTSCTYQAIYLMEIQGRQLIDDNTDRHVLALTTVDSRC